jgi:hypothetical protein
MATYSENVCIEDRVRLKAAIPQLGLHPGDEGLVCSVWFSPDKTFEVEFGRLDLTPIRALVPEEELEASEELLFRA